MARSKAEIPALRFHVSGSMVCTLDGKNFYLGPPKDTATIARYAVLIQAYQANDYRLPAGLTIDDVRRLADAQIAPLTNSQQEHGPVLVRHVTAAWKIEAAKKYANQPTELKRCEQICNEIDQQDG